MNQTEIFTGKSRTLPGRGRTPGKRTAGINCFLSALLFMWVLLAGALPLPAQTNTPARLALISATDDASTAADMLTAQLTGNPKLQLLERDQIAKVYHEQGLSAGNTDCVKLGQLLGADGVLLLETAREGTNESLNVRLVAVKPGVVVIAEKFPWPVKTPTEWSAAFVGHLDIFLPKLTIPLKEAIPISVVNLRSAVSSREAAEMERQLKLLTIQRLSQEPQLFVLERQQMQLLSGEKELKADDSPFWNGSYLLEGVVDQNGYSPDTITINARLTPATGSTPIMFAMSGSRTNLADVINQLALKVDGALKVSATVPAWNATDEAEQYFNEASWALRWGVYREAEAAADSAWALGKTNVLCARLRVQAYIADVLANTARYQFHEYSLGSGYDENGHPTGPMPGEAAAQTAIQSMRNQYTFGLVWQEFQFESQHAREIKFASADRYPDGRNIDQAMQALQIYDAFNRSSYSQGWPADFLKNNPDWYHLGIADLVAASQVLQNFNFFPASQDAATDKLAELRALARSVANWLCRAPSVHDTYFVGDRIVSHDELGNTIGDDPNIFRCEVKWGCFWQDRPEDGLALYRELMASPVFSYIHQDFWLRDLSLPRLAAWKKNDRQRLPAAWDNFMRELKDSPNPLLQLEALALTLADAHNESETGGAFTNFFRQLLASHDTLVANNVEVLYLNWGADDLAGAKTGGGSSAKDAWRQLFYSEYRPKLEAMDQEYWQTTYVGTPPRGKQSAFEKQKQFLQASQPFDPQEFNQQFFFGFKDYSQAQALELLPLLATYKTKLTGIWAGVGALQVDQLVSSLHQILNPPAPSVQPKIQPPPPQQVPALVKTPPPPAKVTRLETVTNVIVAKTFSVIPLDSLVPLESSEHIDLAYTRITINAHHWIQGKLLLDFHYNVFIDQQIGARPLIRTRNVSGLAIAMLDPAAEHWDVFGCPDVGILDQNPFYHRTTLWHGELFTCNGGQIIKYDRAGQQWQTLAVSETGNCELFAVNEHLYAANRNMIFEILSDGRQTHILASTRRQPAVSVLDSEDLGTPALFEGPDHSLRASTRNKIFTWADTDWHPVCAMPPASFPPEIVENGVLFFTDGFNLAGCVSRLATANNETELCLGHKTRPEGNDSGSGSAAQTNPSWNLPSGLYLPNLASASRQSDLYLMADHAEVRNLVDDRQHLVVGKKLLPKNDYQAELLCFSPGIVEPEKVFLRFENPDGCPPVTGADPATPRMQPSRPPAWLLFTTNFLFCGLENPSTLFPNEAENIDIGHQPGVWMLPVKEIDSALAEQKQMLLDKQARAKAATEQLQKNFLAKYDLNHNGVIDPEEREEAIDDPAYIESELELIDSNHNGWLDAPEIAWFDADQNAILGSKEEAGIAMTQKLLAQKLLGQFDSGGKGILGNSQYNELIQTFPQPELNARFNLQFAFADENHDGHVDLGELQDVLYRYTELTLQSRGQVGVFFPGPMGMSLHQTEDSRQAFKQSVKSYWRNSGKTAIRAPLSPQVKQFQKDFLAKYDHNHNGVLDPDERTEASDDPDFTKFMINELRARRSAAVTNSSP